MISQFLTRPVQRSRRKPPVDDPQRRRLYRMEREFLGSSVYHSVSCTNLQVVANNVCRYYGVAPIEIRVYDRPGEKEFGAFVYQLDPYKPVRIELNRGFHGANISTLLHELAHYVSDKFYENIETHGRQFAAIYMHLLDKYRILPAVAFRVLAKKHGVRIAGRFKPAALRG